MDNDLTIQLNVLSQGVDKINAATGAIQNLDKASKTASQRMSDFGKKMESTGSRINVLGQRMTWMVTAPLLLFANKSIQTALDVDKAWVRMRKVFDGTEEDLADLKEAAWSMSTTFGIAFEESAEVLVEFSKAGITSKEELAELGKITAETSILFDSTMSEALTGVKSIMFGFGLTVEQTAQELAAINTISDQTTASEKGVMEMLSKVAGTARAAGFSIREVASAQAVFEANAIPAGRAGNAMKSILTSLTKQSNLAKDQFAELGVSMTDTEWKTSSGTDKLEKLAKKLAEIKEIGNEETLKEFNKQIGDMSEALGDMDEGPIEKLQLLKASLVEAEISGDQVRLDGINKELEGLNIEGGTASEKIENMTENLKALEATGRTVKLDQANEALASLVGKFQINNLNVLLQDLAKNFDDSEETVSIFYDALSKGEKDLVNATFKGKQLEEVMNSSSVKVAKLEQAYSKQASILGEELLPYKIQLMEFLTKILDKFNKLDPATKDWIKKISILVATLGPLLSIVGLVITGLGFFVSAVSTLGLVFSGVISGIILALPILLLAWTKNWGGIQEKTWEVLNSVKTWVSEHWDDIKSIMENAWTAMKGVFDVGWGAIKLAFDVAMALFSGDWVKDWDLVKSDFGLIWHGENGEGGMVGIVSGSMGAMKDAVKLGTEAIVDLFKKMNTQTQVVFVSLGVFMAKWWLARKLETLAIMTLYTVDWIRKLSYWAIATMAEFTAVGGAAGVLQGILSKLAIPIILTIAWLGYDYLMQQVRNANEAINSLEDSNEDFNKKMKSLTSRLKDKSISTQEKEAIYRDMKEAGEIVKKAQELMYENLEKNKTYSIYDKLLTEAKKNAADSKANLIESFNTGGLVYASQGFAPRGRDTVPAMLSPGEMVLNRSQQANLFNIISGKSQLAGGGGATVNINVNGNMIASRGEQREFARKIKELLEEDNNRY